MKRKELEAIKARCDAATDGPWKIRRRFDWVVLDPYGDSVISGDDGPSEAFHLDLADAEFIAHAREDVPRLVGEVERLRECLGWLYFNCQIKPHSTAKLPESLVEIREMLDD
jgi:hypothetical protein